MMKTLSNKFHKTLNCFIFIDIFLIIDSHSFCHNVFFNIYDIEVKYKKQCVQNEILMFVKLFDFF